MEIGESLITVENPIFETIPEGNKCPFFTFKPKNEKNYVIEKLKKNNQTGY